MENLETIEQQVLDMQKQSQDAEDVLTKQPPEQWDPQMRNDLAQVRRLVSAFAACAPARRAEFAPHHPTSLASAQLHGNANKLLATKIDAILTSAPPPPPHQQRQLSSAVERSHTHTHRHDDSLSEARRALAGELISGRDDARAKRKALIKVVEKLIETVEDQVKRFDKLRPAQSPTAPSQPPPP